MRWPSAITALLLLSCAACDNVATDLSDQDYESMVLGRASVEFSCPSSQITITQIDHVTYFAEGCGYRATYDCDSSGTAIAPGECQREPDLGADAGFK